MKKIRMHLLISGRVQMVLLRFNTRRQARKLGVFGWVKNLSDGRVEAVLEGEESSVLKLVEWAKKGPIFANVKNIEIYKEEYSGEFVDFNILY